MPEQNRPCWTILKRWRRSTDWHFSRAEHMARPETVGCFQPLAGVMVAICPGIGRRPGSIWIGFKGGQQDQAMNLQLEDKLAFVKKMNLCRRFAKRLGLGKSTKGTLWL